MPYHKLSTVTQNGMTPSQPGMSVSSTSPILDGARLNVSRYYQDLPNEWGGKGTLKSLDCDGMIFPTSEDAHKFAFSRGYLQNWFGRGYPHRAYRSAFKTFKSGGYKGRRKLTKWLVGRLSTMNSNNIGYQANWFGENVVS